MLGKILTLLLISVHLVLQTAAADKPTVDSILDRYVREIGGKEALEKTKTVLMEGSIEIGGGSGDVKIMRMAPDKTGWRVVFNGENYAQVFDGKTSWKLDPSQIDTLSARELRALKRSSITPQATAIREIYPDLEYKGIEKLESEEVHILESKPSPNLWDRLAFSTRTGLLIGRTSKDGEAKIAARFSDYKKEADVSRPHQFSEKTESPEGDFEYTVKITKVTINSGVKTEDFAKPK